MDLSKKILIGIYWAIYDSGITLEKAIALNELIDLIGYKPERKS